MAVVSALSSVLDVSPVSMDPIADTVDTDALDRIVRGFDIADGAVEVTWTHAGYEVTVSSVGSVTVSPANDDHTGASVER